MNIILCASDNYTMQCGVTICSVCENNRDSDVDFYVITDDDFTDEHKQQLRDLVASYDNKTITFIIVKENQIDKFIQFETPWWTKHIFYRLLSAELIKSIDKAIYFDCDVIVRHSLTDFWNIDLTDYAVGCIYDSMEGLIEFYNRLGYSSDLGYFNSGVLLMNLKYWREKGITDKFFDFIQKFPEKLKCPDQDVLNYVLRNEKLKLSSKFNFQSGFLFKKHRMTFDYSKYCNELEEASKDPIILHLSGARPWFKGRISHPYQSEWFKYKALTIWKNDPLLIQNKTLKVKLREFFRPLFSKFGLCSLIEDPYNRNYQLSNSTFSNNENDSFCNN